MTLTSTITTRVRLTGSPLFLFLLFSVLLFSSLFGFFAHHVLAGIGTYDINETTVHKSWYGEMCSSISQTIDQGVGTTFDAHVMAGYRFLMRYYDSVSRLP